MDRKGNAAPRVYWSKPFERGHFRHRRLYVAAPGSDVFRETPFFIDTALKSYARCLGQKHGLHGSGMHPSGGASTIAANNRLEPLKHKAEQMALDRMETES